MAGGAFGGGDAAGLAMLVPAPATWASLAVVVISASACAADALSSLIESGCGITAFLDSFAAVVVADGLADAARTS